MRIATCTSSGQDRTGWWRVGEQAAACSLQLAAAGQEGGAARGGQGGPGGLNLLLDGVWRGPDGKTRQRFVTHFLAALATCAP